MLFQHQTQQYGHGYDNLHGCFSIFDHIWNQSAKENNWESFSMYIKNQKSGFYQKTIIYGNTLDSNYQNGDYVYSGTDIVKDIQM